MIPVQKAMQAYSMTMNLNKKEAFYSRRDVDDAQLHKTDEKEMKKKFESILQKAIQKST